MKLSTTFGPLYMYSSVLSLSEGCLHTRIHMPGESIPQLRFDVGQLTSDAFPGEEGSALYERVARDEFIRALNDPSLQAEVWRQRPRNIEEAARYANEMESLFAQQ